MVAGARLSAGTLPRRPGAADRYLERPDPHRTLRHGADRGAQGPGVGQLRRDASGRPAQLRHQARSEEHTSELQSLMRSSYAVFCLKKKTKNTWQSKEVK